jgi:hypothetical protein
MSKPSVHCGGTELFNIEKLSFIVTRLSYMVEKMKAISEGSRENVKAPSCCKFCKSSTALQLFKESTALLAADYRLQKSVGQTTDGNRARLQSLFGMKFTQVPSQYSNELEKYKQQSKYGCMQRCLPATYPAKAALPFGGSSNNELHSCRLSIAEKHGANN